MSSGAYRNFSLWTGQFRVPNRWRFQSEPIVEFALGNRRGQKDRVCDSIPRRSFQVDLVLRCSERRGHFAFLFKAGCPRVLKYRRVRLTLQIMRCGGTFRVLRRSKPWQVVVQGQIRLRMADYCVVLMRKVGHNFI